MKLMAKVYCSGNLGNVADYTIVSLNDRMKQNILQFREVFQMAKSATKDLASMTLLLPEGYFYRDYMSLTQRNMSEKEKQDFRVRDWTLLSNHFEQASTSDWLSTEDNRLVVTEYGFQFIGTTADSDARIESAVIPYDIVTDQEDSFSS